MNRTEQPQTVTEQTEPTSRSEPWAQSSVIRPANESSLFSSEPSNNVERSVELHIEELVLDGFGPGDRHLIGEAVERELTRLFTEQASPIAATHDVQIAHVNGGAINVKPGSNWEAVGIQLARIIYGGLSQ